MADHVSSPHLDQFAAARYLGGLSTKTLERWRVTGQGPTYRKFGRRVLYTIEDLDHWAASQARRSTASAAAE